MDFSKELVRAKKWLHLSDEIIGPFGGNNLFSPMAWLSVHRRTLRPDLVIKAGHIGLEGARKHLHPFIDSVINDPSEK